MDDLTDLRAAYRDPLVVRYSGKEVPRIFSDDFKFGTWRRCWTALAEAEMELGLDIIKPEMISELVAAQGTIDYDAVSEVERRIRHDVLAHLAEYSGKCPTAAPIIHLGATSQFVGCNTDLIQMREGMKLLRGKLVNTIYNLAQYAREHKDLVTLGYTHGQPAQPTTIGKRFTLYISDLLMDLEAIEALQFKARGAKGTTGTQASYLRLFGGDFTKVQQLDRLVAAKLGFTEVFPVTGQTYSRKFDTKVSEALAGIAVSLGKFANDMRLSSRDKIVDEPFAIGQRGSSAMPHKRNPMRHERMSAIARELLGMPRNFYDTAVGQWFERTLDDSAIRRMDIPRSFLAADALLVLGYNITSRNVEPTKGRPLTFYPAMIERLLAQELPFMATEMILMDAVTEGGDRDELHSLIEHHAHATGTVMKEQGADNDLFARLAADASFPMDRATLDSYLEDTSVFAGAASMQTEAYLEEVVQPVLDEHRDLLEQTDGAIRV